VRLDVCDMGKQNIAYCLNCCNHYMPEGCSLYLTASEVHKTLRTKYDLLQIFILISRDCAS